MRAQDLEFWRKVVPLDQMRVLPDNPEHLLIGGQEDGPHPVAPLFPVACGRLNPAVWHQQAADPPLIKKQLGGIQVRHQGTVETLQLSVDPRQLAFPPAQRDIGCIRREIASYREEQRGRQADDRPRTSVHPDRAFLSARLSGAGAPRHGMPHPESAPLGRGPARQSAT